MSNDPNAVTKTMQVKKKSRGGLIALIVIVVGVCALCAPLCVVGAPKGVAGDTVLEIDLDQQLDEAGTSDGVVPFLPGGEGHNLLDVLLALEKAKTDPKVKGVVARVGAAMPLATMQELREAIASFRASGKPAIAYSEGFGELTPGVSAYTLATSFDEIWLQPSGDVGFTGLFAETMFLKGTLDKIGVDPEFSGRKEYKNAINQLTETTFTPAHKEATVSMLQSLESQIVDDITASRPKLGTKEQVRALLDAGPMSAQDALAKGLVDKLGYKDEMLASLEQRFGKGAKRLWVSKYAERAGVAYKDEGRAPVLALITAKGEVTRGKNGVDPLGGGESFGSDTITAAIRAAADDDEVRVIVLRVDSPGGSYVAADTIWRALEQAKRKGKKIVVSMGDLAASGGYFISMNADKVVAERATLTGSIGVFAGKLVMQKLYDKIGVNVETALADDAIDPTFYASDLPYSERARANLESELDRIYGDFTNKAAQGRKMPIDKLEPLAHGRVWTGADAKTRGLVDDLGGFLYALDAAKEVAGLKKTDEVRLRKFPKEKRPLEQLMALLKGESGDNSDDVTEVDVHMSPIVTKARATLRAIDGAQARGVLSADVPRVQ